MNRIDCRFVNNHQMVRPYSDTKFFFHPVNPVHPVKFKCFNCIVGSGQFAHDPEGPLGRVDGGTRDKQVPGSVGDHALGRGIVAGCKLVVVHRLPNAG